MLPSAEEIRRELRLEPHPTCGYMGEAYASERVRVLYFLVTRERGTRLHRIAPAQMYHHYLGDPLEVLMLHADGRGEVVTLGQDLLAGMRPQLVVPARTWHISRIRAGGSHALLATSEWAADAPLGLELGDARALAESHPEMRSQLAAFTAEVPASAAATGAKAVAPGRP